MLRFRSGCYRRAGDGDMAFLEVIAPCCRRTQCTTGPCCSSAAVPGRTSNTHATCESMDGWGSWQCGARLAASVAASTVLTLGSLLPMVPVGPAVAVLNSPNAQVARTVDAALRRSIPAFNPQASRGISCNHQLMAIFSAKV
jgi:hypothetical protein